MVCVPPQTFFFFYFADEVCEVGKRLHNLTPPSAWYASVILSMLYVCARHVMMYDCCFESESVIWAMVMQIFLSFINL